MCVFGQLTAETVTEHGGCTEVVALQARVPKVCMIARPRGSTGNV